MAPGTDSGLEPTMMPGGLQPTGPKRVARHAGGGGAHSSQTMIGVGTGTNAPSTNPPVSRAPAQLPGVPLSDAPTMGISPTMGVPGGTPAPSDPGPAPTAHLQPVVLREGLRINQYELIRELGRGGMGQVFLARDTRLGRKVAMKFLHLTSVGLSERFLVEARATARCNHENIVIIHEVNEHEGTPFMVLEYLEGDTLRDRVGGRMLPAAQAVEIIIPVLRALVRAHEFNIIHRDLKPDNIFVTSTGSIKVLDFGIAKLFSPEEEGDDFLKTKPLALHGKQVTGAAKGAKQDDFSYAKAAPLTPSRRPRVSITDQDGRKRLATGTFSESDLDSHASSDLTGHGGIVGTAAYMAPEQWGIGAVDHRTDLWAVGMILYEMLAGEHPLGAYPPQALMRKAMRGKLEAPDVRENVPGLPEEIALIIDRCLEPEKEDRYASAARLLEDLERVQPGRLSHRFGEDESPYPGLTAFQEADAGRFFGRDAEIGRTVIQLRERPLLGIVGPSGVGKSSFIRAGVIPALKAGGETWEVYITRPGRNPISALASVLQPLTRSSAADLERRVEEQEELTQKLKEEPGYFGSLLRSRARARGHSILLFVDQFEELYTLVSNPWLRRAYTACLRGMADDSAAPLRVVLSMRSDFLDRIAEDPEFMEDVTRGLLFLQQPDSRGLQEAISRPAELAGYRFGNPEIVAEMLQALEDTPGALPLLQFAASKLWDARDKQRKVLTEESYRKMGGISGALASHADEVVAGLAGQGQKYVRAIFQRLVTAEGTRAVVDVADLVDLAPDANEIRRIVDYLVQARLLVVQSRSEEEGPAVELVHESLIEGWPTLKRWLDESHEYAAFLEQLRSAAKQWRTRGRPPGLIWRGDMQEEAERFRRRYKGDLAAGEQEYLGAVVSLATRSARIRRWVVVAAFAILLLLVGAALAAVAWIADAEKEAVAEAKRARTAEKRVQNQIETIRAKEKARAQAEDEKHRAMRDKKTAEGAVRGLKSKVETGAIELKATKLKLDMSGEELRAALIKARAERKKAVAATRVARAALGKAREAQKRAEKATKVAEKAKKDLAKKLAREKALNRKLKRKIETTLR